MSKLKKFLKCILIILALVITLFVGAILGIIWYDFFDIYGLTLYSGEAIADTYHYEERVWFVTEGGKVYAAGEYNQTDSRTYRNSEFTDYGKWGTPIPILIYDRGVKKLVPYSHMGTLIISDDGELYNSYDMSFRRLAENISDAYYDPYDKNIYAVKHDGSLYLINENKKIADSILAVKAYRGRVFVLTKDSDLCELVYDRCNDSYFLTNAIFEDVQAFDILDTTKRYYEGKHVYDDPDALATPMITVLTNSGNLYIKGAYTYLHTFTDDPANPRVFKEWQLIGEDVNEFSTAPMGTVMMREDGTGKYFGFGLTEFSESKLTFGSTELSVNGITDVYASDFGVYVRCGDKYCSWGSIFGNYFIRYTDQQECDVFGDEPNVVSFPTDN